MKTATKWLLVSCGVLALVIGVLMMLEPPEAAQLKDDSRSALTLPPVTVTPVVAGSHAGQISAFAEVRPRWQATIRAHVRGEITDVQVLEGQQVQAGELLLKLEDSAYQANLAQARQGVADAKVQVLEERTRVMGNQTSNPRIQAAELQVKTAEARLREAQQNLKYTQVEAPFAGVVTERQVSLGQTVEAGDSLYHLMNNDVLLITVNLNEKQWQQLAEDWQNGTARLLRADGSFAGTARIAEGGGFVNRETRQYQVYLEWQKADNQQVVLPGEFVRIELPAKRFTNSLLIPESAMARTGKVWYLDEEDRLRFFHADLLAWEHKQIIVQAPDVAKTVSPLRIVNLPMAGFLDGAKVRAIDTTKVAPAKPDKPSKESASIQEMPLFLTQEGRHALAY